MPEERKNRTTRLVWARSEGELKRIKREGKRVHGDHFSIWIAAPGDAETGEVRACVICGRGFKNAVGRNRARRRARGCLLDLRRELVEGLSYLVECRPSAGTVDYQILVSELRKAVSS